jgi:hypothetical protein
MAAALKNKKGRSLPDIFDIAHDLCFVIHDVMVQILKSGEEGGFFKTTIDLNNDDEKTALENTDDIFLWLENNHRFDDRAKILITTIFPAVLSDMMHCTYESLETSRKGKLGISYMLIRKPLQESLYLLEAIVLNELDFAEMMSSDPLKLRQRNAGGVEGHCKRIEQVITLIGEDLRLNALYIAQLRYDKSKEDSFDGICNKAMHLFTEHIAIRTEPLNINFIFSGWDQKLTQWAYLYSRLPYLLFYTYQIVEYVVAKIIAPTSQEYLDDMQRRISALIILWSDGLNENYVSHPLEVFVQETQKWLNEHCKNSGFQTPTKKDLLRMSKTGAYPRESAWVVKKRDMKYRIHATLNNVANKP